MSKEKPKKLLYSDFVAYFAEKKGIDRQVARDRIDDVLDSIKEYILQEADDTGCELILLNFGSFRLLPPTSSPAYEWESRAVMRRRRRFRFAPCRDFKRAIKEKE